MTKGVIFHGIPIDRNAVPSIILQNIHREYLGLPYTPCKRDPHLRSLSARINQHVNSAWVESLVNANIYKGRGSLIWFQPPYAD